MLAFYILTAIITAMALGAVAAFLYNRKKDLFRYRTVYFAGLAVFLAVQAFVMLSASKFVVLPPLKII